MIDLNKKEEITKHHNGDTIVTSIDSLSEQIRQAFTETLEIKFPENYKNIKSILVCGMGGTRFPALIIRELFKEKIKIPYLVNDDYVIPGFVNTETLVILSSYSGTTEEIITVGKAAIEKGAKMTCVTAGGEIKNILASLNAPHYIFNPIHNPSGQPRLGYGYALGAHLGFLVNLGFLDVSKEEVFSALDKLEDLIATYKVEVPFESNFAKQFAEKLINKHPYFIVSEFLNGVGNSIANQINENAKTLASHRIIPELNHHLMEGLKHPDLKQNTVFVFLNSKFYSPQIQKRFTVTKEVIEQNGIETIWIELKGENKIEQSFEVLAFTGYFSMYLAALYEEDPGIIPFVDYFKKRLKEI